MTDKNDGGPAFPQHRFAPMTGGGGYWTQEGGMTLRDWFAGQFLCGVVSSETNEPLNVAEGETVNDALRRFWIAPAIAAYIAADAMLAARNK